MRKDDPLGEFNNEGGARVSVNRSFRDFEGGSLSLRF